MPSNKYSSAIMAESDKMTATVRWKKSVGIAVRFCHVLPTLYSFFLLLALFYAIRMNGDKLSKPL